MRVDRRLGEFIAREAIAEPYRQVQVMDTRRFANWLRDRGINLSWQALHDLWELGVLHPIAVLEQALDRKRSDRFAKVDLGYDVKSFVDLGAHVESAMLRGLGLDIPSSHADALLWHPYQLLSFSRLDRVMGLNIATEAPLHGPDPFTDLARRSAERVLAGVKDFANSPEQIELMQVQAVLIAAEPLVHGMINSRITTNPIAGESFDGYFKWARSTDGASIADRVGISLEKLEEWHHNISVDAQLSDPLERWRTLIRHASRDKRSRLKGKALRADTLYDAAEVLRRYLETYHSRKLPEEDDALHGPQSQAVKERQFGDARTADFDRAVFRRVVRSFDLDPQARTTWFFEGDTEEAFIEEAARRMHIDLNRAGVELMNLRGLGGLDSDRFRSLLERLQREQVFPYVTIDLDMSPENPRLLKHYADDGLLPAGFRVWDPDFEAANFTLDELAEIATQVAADGGLPVTITRDQINDEMKQSQVPVGKAITRIWSRQKFYGGKGKEWGHRLAEWAMTEPCPQELMENERRPAIGVLHFVLRGQSSDYTSTIEAVDIDDRGNLVQKVPKDREEPPEPWRPRDVE